MGIIWIADGHCDSLGDFTEGKRDLRGTDGFGHWDLKKAREANIGMQFFTAYIEEEFKPFLAGQRGLQHLEAALRFSDENEEAVFIVKSREDLSGLGKTRRVGLLINVEGGEILGESLFMLSLIFRLGVRSIGLTWNQRNAIADGVGEKGSKGGLTQFGSKVIEKMNDLGMIIDVSHINEAGFWDVISSSRTPVIASHSCAYRLCSHPRNLKDEQLRALAENKGLVGINFCPDFLRASGRATIDDVVNHIRYIAETAGVETVAFGSDFDGIPVTPEGLEDASRYPLLVEKLFAAGFHEKEIIKMCHGNFVRVLNDVLK
jgi:membrane dipeptidase